MAIICYINESTTSPLLAIFVQTHLPGYVQDYEKLKASGVDTVACISVNDVYVMKAWGKDRGATGKVRMLADVNGEFTKVCSM